MQKPVITVFGATGSQGGGLVRAILRDPLRRFNVRAVTRRPEAAAQLTSLGAQAVLADLDDPASLREAMRGAWGAFCVTNFWEHLSPAREGAQAAHLAEAAADANVAHVVWSTLEDTRRFIPCDGRTMPMLAGGFNVPHFDAKGAADALFRAAGLRTTFLLTSFYWENFIGFGMGPQRGAGGRLAITLPLGGAKLPGIAAEDIGRCALGVFAQSEHWMGRTVGIAGEHLSGAAMAGKFQAAFGEPVVYAPLGWNEYRALGFPGADDLGNMFQFKVLCETEFRAARDVELARSLNPSLMDFDAWLARRARAIPRPAAAPASTLS